MLLFPKFPTIVVEWRIKIPSELWHTSNIMFIKREPGAVSMIYLYKVKTSNVHNLRVLILKNHMKLYQQENILLMKQSTDVFNKKYYIS